ncbi:hypothetical protein C8F04DRAFT_1186942 [Mycena alexandri]|uniref:Uncharacterized protein n=1 Tax=Mycena alexandri TaxID=1745969 RepID=A0AAD6SMJ3_9AGAR|nr:hypothetical protein C8F04DRAFT_1186942 [Mycena alexandri]
MPVHQGIFRGWTPSRLRRRPSIHELGAVTARLVDGLFRPQNPGAGRAAQKTAKPNWGCGFLSGSGIEVAARQAEKRTRSRASFKHRHLGIRCLKSLVKFTNPSAAVNGRVFTAVLPPVPARLFVEADVETARHGVPFTGPVPPVKTGAVGIPIRGPAFPLSDGRDRARDWSSSSLEHHLTPSRSQSISSLGTNLTSELRGPMGSPGGSRILGLARLSSSHFVQYEDSAWGNLLASTLETQFSSKMTYAMTFANQLKRRGYGSTSARHP